MYIWIGAKLPEEFETYIRSLCLPLSKSLGLDVSGFTLPQHISLKISFQAGDRYEEILDFIENRFRMEKKFYVNPRAPQRQGSILWMPFRINPPLRHLHNMLDRELKDHFGIRQHLFDQEFAFHSTLFLGDAAALSRAEELLRNMPLPGQLEINTILLGLSESGKSGTYRVVREISL